MRLHPVLLSKDGQQAAVGFFVAGQLSGGYLRKIIWIRGIQRWQVQPHSGPKTLALHPNADNAVHRPVPHNMGDEGQEVFPGTDAYFL